MLSNEQFSKHIVAYTDAILEHKALLEAREAIKASGYQSLVKHQTIEDIELAIIGVISLQGDIEHALQYGKPTDVI
jgi:hypothetical protein